MADDDPERSDDAAPSKDGQVDQARRKLLRAMVYAAPVVTSTAVVKQAHAQGMSCGPASCNPNGGPCNPNGGPCNPMLCNPNGGPCGPSMCPPRN